MRPVYETFKNLKSRRNFFEKNSYSYNSNGVKITDLNPEKELIIN